jgi:hypothetical protein
MLLILGLISSIVAEFPARVDAESPQFKADCGLHGQVGAKFPGGRFVPARDAKVYVFYSSAYVDRGMRDKFFTHQPSPYDAGGRFSYGYMKLVEHDKALMAIAKEKHAQSDERAVEIATRTLRYEDESIAATLDWAAKHPKDAWQVLVITPDEQGLWEAKGLWPGSYEIVVRGKVSRMDADWVFSVDLEPGDTQSLEYQPRFFRPLRWQ